MATEGGHAPLSESMAVLGVPSLSKKAFMSTEKRIGIWWWDFLKESIKQAGEEEKVIAIYKGYYHQGISAITVTVDGGWSKRSHKHSYNTKSGVGIIIGKETRKILYMGVRNKYCSVSHNTTGDTISPHDCFLNWDQSSSAMESDIIVTGFLQSEKQHGLRYARLIGDSDSSALVSRVPYGYFIKKLECANHAVRTTMKNLVHDKPSYEGRGKLTETTRKKLTKAAHRAILMRSREADQVQAAQKLQRDMLNSPLHCFGCYTNCSPDFCKTVQQQQ